MKIIAQARPTQDGDGVNIQRIAAFHGLAIDPFLMIDEICSDEASDYIGGFPPHPHRGIETFTYIKKGGFEHRDQMGNVKAIRAGDIQWMSTGRGVIHSEMPLADAVDGLHGFQIWLNMPAKHKMDAPRYYDSADGQLPVLESDTSLLKGLAGNWSCDLGEVSAPLQLLAGDSAVADVELKADGEITVAPLGQRIAVFCYRGEIEGLKQGYVALHEADKPLHLKAVSESSILLLRGTPIGESIVHMGPFVMNTQAEIDQAITDYRAGRFGSI